jgi:pyruvate dehydrogenase (quinone)
MPRKMQGTDYFQATDTNLLFHDVSLYTETISSPAQAPAVIHQAIAAAYAGRGVAHLTLPQDVINQARTSRFENRRRPRALPIPGP